MQNHDAEYMRNIADTIARFAEVNAQIMTEVVAPEGDPDSAAHEFLNVDQIADYIHKRGKPTEFSITAKSLESGERVRITLRLELTEDDSAGTITWK